MRSEKRRHIFYVDFRNNNITLLMPFSIENLPEIEAHLATHPTLNEGGAPGAADATIFTALGKLPDRQTHPNLHYWYLFISSFTPVVLQRWSASSKPAEVKKTQAPKTNDDDFDPFADDAEVPAKKVEKPQPKPAKAAKPKPVAKSIVVFEVKIYDAEVTNLDELAQKILALKIDGLVWNNKPKKLQVAFGIQKLQMGCVIEDEKVLTDDIFDQILAWEDDVQSVDMTSMQKL